MVADDGVPTSALPPGTAVVLHGLVSRSDLNGKRATTAAAPAAAAAAVAQKGRQRVEVDEDGTALAVSLKNLRLAPAVQWPVAVADVVMSCWRRHSDAATLRSFR